MGTAARTLPRAALALGIGLTIGVAGAVSATADDEPTPGPSTTNYPEPEEPTLTAEIFQPICDGDVPYLRYAVKATGTDNDTVTITWNNPTGADVVQAGLPLSGRVLWPGAEVAADGSPLDWPGWRLENGVWVEGDEYDWVRPSVDVKFEVNPELTMTAAYPPSSPDCATNPPGTPPENPPTGSTPTPGSTAPGAVPPGAAQPPAGTASGGILPRTGAEVGMLAAIAAGLVAAGGVTVAAVRRRRSAS